MPSVPLTMIFCTVRPGGRDVGVDAAIGPAAFGGVGDSRRFNGGDASVGAGGNILLLRSAATNWGELPANVPIVWG